MLKHIPWSKDVPLPEMNDDNILHLFEEFRKSPNCPSSVNWTVGTSMHWTKIRVSKTWYKNDQKKLRCATCGSCYPATAPLPLWQQY